MTYIPDDLVFGKIKFKVKCHSQFNNAEIGAEMTAGLADLINQKLPDLGCQFTHLVIRDILYVTCFVNRIKDHFNFVFQGAKGAAPP